MMTVFYLILSAVLVVQLIRAVVAADSEDLGYTRLLLSSAAFISWVFILWGK